MLLNESAEDTERAKDYYPFRNTKGFNV
jgi:hypothetical protein